MNAAELKNKTKDELLEQLLTLRKEQFNLRMQMATGQNARPDQIRNARKNVARVKTVLRAQEIAAEKESA
jgi:large subunit ribosomal protein L29